MTVLEQVNEEVTEEVTEKEGSKLISKSDQGNVVLPSFPFPRPPSFPHLQGKRSVRVCVAYIWLVESAASCALVRCMFWVKMASVASRVESRRRRRRRRRRSRRVMG